MGRISKGFSLLFVVILVVSSLSLLIVKPANAQSSPVIIVAPTPTLTSTSAPTPTPTRNIAMDYSEISRASEGVDTRLVLAINVKYNFGEPVTINFQNFTLNIAVERGGPPPIQPGDFIYTGTAKPIETGSVTIDSNSNEDSFQLAFEFPTMQENVHGQTPFTNYQLVYSGSTTPASPSPTPTVPEFPAIALLPLVALVSIAIAFKLKKTRR
jgi:hypothetical protein